MARYQLTTPDGDFIYLTINSGALQPLEAMFVSMVRDFSDCQIDERPPLGEGPAGCLYCGGSLDKDALPILRCDCHQVCTL